MILICPSCGATASANAWENDMTARDALQVMLALPEPVTKVILGYLGLFRPAARALTWRKAHHLAADLAALIAPGYVQVQGKPARPCPPRIWAQAMEQMAARHDLARPMKNHNYLRQIAWSLADQADARQEQNQHAAETDGSHRVSRPAAEPEGMSEIMRKALAQQGRK